ncbi:MAG: fumarylacetoacetate hydrolase family protein [Hyphomicrobiaceae bacterium]|nr:fumarylacetoacetate hydrolase family protein [Hyphomicrobiaceae bacterium]
MTMADALEDAAALIWRHWQQGTVITALPEAGRPATRRDGYAIQAAVRRHFGRDDTGWKIAATSKAGQVHIGVDGPIAGRMPAERTYASGATISLAGNRMRVAEPEFAFRVGKRIAPRTARYTVEEAVGAMDALIPSIEVPDSRFADFAAAGGAQLIADCACARDFVLGTPAPDAWRSIDLARHAVHGRIIGRLERDGIGSNVLDDPRLALAWIVNELSALGIPLEPGEIVTTGTCMSPLAIEPGDHVMADFGALGRIEARFA